MKTIAFFLLVTVGGIVLADTPVPYYPRSFDKNQSMGAINQNLQDITGRNRDRLVGVVGNATCGSTQALLGATEKNGYIFGGSCGGPIYVLLPKKTLAQIVATKPSDMGEMYSCTDCAVPGSVAVSTGTGTGNFGVLAPTTLR